MMGVFQTSIEQVIVHVYQSCMFVMASIILYMVTKVKYLEARTDDMTGHCEI